ncbi:MAG TPA: RiPP maturation radical SAM C-methyltransferase [Jatrophihabitans sp.]|nr:RiPP maturation radical SAM C-methyltransferase [Jatrophihabitans sp.]
MHLVLAVTPWHLLHHAHAAAELLAGVLDPPHRATVHYANLTFAELLRDADRDDPGRYHRLAESGYLSGIGDWVFTRALYGQGDHAVEDARGACASAGFDWEQTLAAHRIAERWADLAAADILALQPDAVGLSTTFAQSVAALALARRLKRQRPDLPVVFGGSNCDGPMGAALQRSFPAEIDFVVRGEGEQPLRQLVNALDTADPADRERQLGTIAGLCRWRAGTQVVQPEGTALPEGEELRGGTQDAYFDAVASSEAADWVRPGLVLETSRGCWWGQRKHCTFCGLSDRTIRFRAKPARTASEELLGAVDRHQVLDVMTTDNILDLAYLDSLLPELAAAGLDLHLFYEIKANLTAEQLATLRAAGVLTVQPGIENLHSAPLKLMDKGSTGAMNVALLRELQGNGMTTMWNYLYGFPGESAAHYLPVIAQLPNLVHLLPPAGAYRHIIERFNPYFERPELGFARRAPMPWYRWVYPHVADGDLDDLAYLFASQPAGIDEVTASALREAVAAWQDHYHCSSLTHRLVGDTLTVYDRRHGRDPVDHRICDPAAVAAYRELARPHSAERLTARQRKAGHDIDEPWARAFLAELHRAGLTYADGDTHVALSLAHDPRLRRLPAGGTTLAIRSAEQLPAYAGSHR